jgi:hypothetical protein
MRTHCDKCKSEIVEDKCSCGVWGDREDFPDIHPYEAAMLKYNELCEEHGDYSALGGDHFTGTCIVIFKGNYDKCMKVKEYVDSLEVKNEEKNTN